MRPRQLNRTLRECNPGVQIPVIRIIQSGHAFLDMPVATFERTMRVNLHGAYFMVQAAANQMVRQGRGGSIVAVSSISALVGGEFQTHYTPTKAGDHSLMQSAAIVLGRHGIRCNSVMPGTIATDINKDDWPT